MRFPEFSGEWKKYSFNDIAQYKKGPFGSALKKEIFVPKSADSVKIYEQQNAIKKDWELGRYYISRDYFINHMQQFIVEAGDIIVSCAGTIGEIYELPPNAVSGVFNQALMRVRINATLIDKNIFIKVFSSMIDSFSKIYSNGSAIKNIPPFADLKKTNVFLPTQNEQYKISRLISLLDERIATQNKIIEDLKKLKSAIIHRCYSSQTNMIPLSELLKQCSDRNRSGSDLQVLSVSNKYGFIAQSDQFEDREVASDDTSNYKVVKKGMFAYNPARINVGSIALYEMDSNGIVSPMYVCFTTKSELLPSYLKYYFASQTFKHEMYKRLEGSVRLCLTFEELCNIEIHLPSIEQQKNISKYISKIENNLSLVDSIFSKYQQQRRYLLSQMFI